MKDQTINRQWKRIIDTMNDGLILIGPDGTIVMVNQAFERMSGYTADELIGQPCTLLGCDACEGTLQQGEHFWCTLFEKGTDIRCRCTILRKDGSALQVLKNAALLEDEQGWPLGSVENFADLTELEALDRKIDQLSRQLDAENGFMGIVGNSPRMQNVFDIIRKAAQSDAPVIIHGESGTGKELAARAIHELGPRRDAAFVMVNCASLNEALLESELFGHTKGAFTGAYRHRQGRFEVAHGGDLFLDEIGDVPASIQVKLLRFLETQAFERVGEEKPIAVNVRIITATNKDLDALIARGDFRQDFFFRINVIPIHLPPLRERKEDIPHLVSAFIGRLQEKTAKAITGLSAQSMEYFMRYEWPGNVRELKSALEYAFVVAEKGVIDPVSLPQKITDNRAGIGKGSDIPAPNNDQKQQLIDALRAAGGNQTRAARILGINRVTVWNRIRKYGINLKTVVEDAGG